MRSHRFHFLALLLALLLALAAGCGGGDDGEEAQETQPAAGEEAEVNERLRRFHPDVAALRRYLVDDGFLDRAEGMYWRTGGTVDV